MKLPRLTIKQMMILVAVLAVASQIGRDYWTRQLRFYDPVNASQLHANVGDTPSLAPGQSVPVSISYHFQFGTFNKPAPGTTVTVLGSVWLQDQETGYCVDGYTFDVPLTVGGRESASEEFVWDALPPHPGRYLLRYALYYSTPLGSLRAGDSGATGCYIGVPRP
jgi:hypothetical protein